MPLSSDQLRQLLTERSEPASSRPAPHERIRMRIRRARIRRTAAVGLAVIVAVADVVTATAALHQHSSGRAIARGAAVPGLLHRS
jgi:hypothetical protein